MTTGRINQVAIATYRRRTSELPCWTTADTVVDRSNDVRGAHFAATASRSTPPSLGHRHCSRRPNKLRGASDRPSSLTVRLPSTRFEVGIRKTVKAPYRIATRPTLGSRPLPPESSTTAVHLPDIGIRCISTRHRHHRQTERLHVCRDDVLPSSRPWHS